MSSFVIEGGHSLQGRILPAGNKNAVLPMMAAALLGNEDYVLTGVPQIADVEVMAALLESLGARVEGLGTETLTINCRQVSRFQIDRKLATRLRASVLLVGPLLARFGRAELPMPGGDIIGIRAVDTHLAGFTQLGIQIEEKTGTYYFQRPSRARQGNEVFCDETSVTATENLLMYAAALPQVTRILNAASEPHVENLAELLISAGARISGAGSNRIEVKGKRDLAGAQGRLNPDHIEIGTFIIAAAVTCGRVVIENVRPSILRMILLYFERMGVNFSLTGTNLLVESGRLHAPLSGKIQTGPWPAFPSDLMSPLIVLATQSQGLTLCHDWMYSWRMFFVDKLIRMGAKIIICDPHRILVEGPTKLVAREAASPDIRAGMSLVLAALAAEGTSLIHRVEHIDRGYGRIETRLQKLGAKIQRVEND